MHFVSRAEQRVSIIKLRRPLLECCKSAPSISCHLVLNMKVSTIFVAALASGARAWSIWRPSGNVLYITTNNAANAIAAIPIGRDGTLSAGQLTYTGGSGANFVEMATGAIARPDALDSQSSLTMAGNVSYAILAHGCANNCSTCSPSMLARTLSQCLRYLMRTRWH